MATYTPKALIGPSAALTSSVTTYASGASTTPIVRSIRAVAQTTSITLTIAFGADAAGTRQYSAQPLTANQVFADNMWIVLAANNTHAIDATSNATGTNCLCTIGGYEFA